MTKRVLFSSISSTAMALALTVGTAPAGTTQAAAPTTSSSESLGGLYGGVGGSWGRS